MEVFVTSVFEKSVKRLAKRFRSMKDVYKKILFDFQGNIPIGEEIQGHRNFYKARYPNPEVRKGKSGGFRLIYFWNTEKENVILVDIYSKTDYRKVDWQKVRRAMAEIEEKGKE